MKFNFPFANKTKALEHHLATEIKNLQNLLDDNEMDEELRELEYKNFSSGESGSSTMGGLAGVVDEFYDKAMLQKLYATETWFFIAVHTIAKTIASLPLKLEKKKKINQNITQSDGTTDQIQKETWIDASGEPEYEILNRPNSLQSSVEFWMLVVIDLMATGDAFIFVDQGDEDTELEDERTPEGRLRRAISKVRKSKVRGMYRLSAGIVKPMPSKSDTKVLGGYQINTEYGIFTFECDDVIHIRLPNPTDHFFGLSPIIPVMKNLLLDKYSAEHMIRFYKQGARLGGVIKTTKKLTKEQLTRLERVFESNFTGKKNHHKTLILPEGMEYDTIEQNPGETSLIEFLKANKEPILAAYNMPPVKVGLLDGATYANAMIQEKTYYNDTIKPICRIVEESINQHGSIIPRLRELKFSFSFDQIEALKEDELNKANTAKAMLESGMSINEVREKVWKLPPVDDGKIVPAVFKNKPQFPTFPAPTPLDGAKDAGQALSNMGLQLNGTQLHSMVELIKNIKDETITQDSALNILQIGFNLTLDQAQKILGIAQVETKDVLNTQDTTIPLSDIKPTGGTFESRVSELVAQAIAAGISAELAVPKAIQQAITEGFSMTPAAPAATDDQKKTEEFVPYTKELLTNHQKATTGEGVQHIIEERLAETNAMFDRMEKFFIKKFNKKKKAYTIKAGDDDGLLPDSDLEDFINDELNRLYESDLKAMRHGYKSSIQSKPMTFPNEEASKELKKVGLKKIKSIVGTTNIQLAKAIITDSFDEQQAPGEIASRIRDVFPEITAGRAMTIARTETLTAVSMGQDLKAQNFMKQFPKEAAKMKRIWISAEDDRVRDSHVELNGKMVEFGEEFAPGLKFPRDPDCGDPSEVINCRCTSIEYLPEMEDEIKDTLANNDLLADAVDKVEE